MPFPSAIEMVEGMQLKYQKYELTYEDFYDEELLAEFAQKGIMNGDLDAIRHLRSAFEVKK